LVLRGACDELCRPLHFLEVLDAVGLRHEVGSGYSKMEAWLTFLSQNAWIKCYINDEVALPNHSLYCLNQYLYANPTGFIIVFGYGMMACAEMRATSRLQG
jgi:hypothetical protein